MSQIFNIAEELEKERKKNKELEEKLKLAKEQDLYEIKIVANGEQYEAYKGTLQDQINELQDRIDKAIEYIETKSEKQYGFNYEYNLEEAEVQDLLKILK